MSGACARNSPAIGVMMAADSLIALAAELDAMPSAARRAILRALTPSERAALDRRLAAETDAAVAYAPPEAASEYSAWIAERIDIARTATGHAVAGNMTSAARQALLQAVGAGSNRPAQRPALVPPGTSGRSLLDAVGGLLGPRRTRP